MLTHHLYTLSKPVSPFQWLSLQIYCDDIEYAKNLTLFNSASAFLEELCDDVMKFS